LGNVNGSGRVEEEAEYLYNVAGGVFEERATHVAKLLGGGAPFGASVQEHFNALEGLGFHRDFSVGAPRRPVLRLTQQAVKRGGAAERCVVQRARICF
jgi:hypothetical protein